MSLITTDLIKGLPDWNQTINENNEILVNAINSNIAQLLDMEQQINTNESDLLTTDAKASDAQTKANNPLAQIADFSIPSAKLKILNEADRIGLEHLKQEVIQSIAGTTPVNAIPADYSVTPIKTSYFKLGNNIFNKATASIGYLLDAYSGTISINATWTTSDFIKILYGTQYYKNNSYGVAFYDTNKSYIGVQANGSVVITVPTNAVYLKFYMLTTDINTTYLTAGTVPIAYEPYMFHIDLDSIVKNLSITNKMLALQSVDTTNTNFITKGKNLFDKSKITKGARINYNNVITTDAPWNYSDYIKIEPNTLYTKNNSYSYCFYDGNFTVLSGADTGKSFTTPSNAVYVRFNLYDDVQTAMLVKGSTTGSYESFYSDFIAPNPHIVYDNPIIVLNSTIYGLVGKEINIYFDNIINGDYKNYDFDVSCAVGQQQNERWTCVPTTAGTYTLTISIYKNGNILNSTTTNIVVKDISVGNAVTKTFMEIGDSTVEDGRQIDELVNLFNADVMNLTSIGTRGLNRPNGHEGRSGWSALLYTTTATDNAFWNPNTSTFDFSYYMTQQAYAGVDYVIINLGINDVFNYTDDINLNTEITNILARYQTMIDSIHLYNANIKIGIAVTIPPSYNQDAFGKSYNCGQNKWRYKRNNNIWISSLINQFSGKEAQYIYLVPINVNLDTKNNMNVETVAINSRNTTTMVTRQTNGVHPATGGYQQIADMIYYWLKSFES